MDKIVALCKRRGLIFPASEIYGGIANTYDYGHYGVLLKNNVVGLWWKAMIQERDDVVALDSAIIQHPRTWEASGHLAGFTDPLVQCLGECKRRFREDHLREEAEARGDGSGHARVPGLRRRAERAAPVQPDVRDDDRAGQGGGLDGLPAPRDRAGHLPRLQDDAAVRAPQAAVRDRAGRQVVPQRDHARQLHLPHARVRADGDGVLRAAGRGGSSGTSTGCRRAWTGTCGSASGAERLRLRAHGEEELSHYSSATSDVEYLYPIGWSELEGIANRGDFDLRQHAEHSGEKLDYVDPGTGERYRAARDRAGRRRRAHGAGAAVRRLRRGGGRGPPAHAAAPAPAGRPGQGRRAAAASTRTASRRRRARSTRTCAGACRPSSTPAARSASATAARTRSARPGASPSTTRRWRTTPSPCATATRSSSRGSRSSELADELERRLAAAWRSPKPSPA